MHEQRDAMVTRARARVHLRRPLDAWRVALLVLALLVTACAPDVVIGQERRLTVVTTTPLADGRWRQAGFRVAQADTDDDADLWYGITTSDGALPSITTLALPRADAIRAGTATGDDWVLAGFITGDDGKRVAWVRALDPFDAERWTVTLPSPDGLETEATAIAVTNEGSLAVAGLEQVSATEQQGWVALLEPTGAVRWRHGFRNGFQAQARGFVPRTITAQDGPPSMSRRQLWLAGSRAIAPQDAPGYALQFTLDGELWDSDPFGGNGSVTRGVVAAGNAGLVLCTAIDGAAQLAWTQGGAFVGAVFTEVRGEAPFTLKGCLGSPTRVTLFGETQRDGASVPTVITVERASRSVSSVDEWMSQRGASVFGAGIDGAGGVRLVGRTQAPLRRWSAPQP